MQVDTDKACRQAHVHGLYCDKLHKTYSCVAHHRRAKQLTKGTRLCSQLYCDSSGKTCPMQRMPYAA
jgi:hypothetical protein